MSRLAVSCAVLLSATALAAACSVYDESLLGAGGVDDTSSSKSGKGNGGEDGDGGAGPTSTGDPTSRASSTVDGSSSSGDSSTGQTGTVTTGEQCQTPDDCPGVDSECSARDCEGNQCSVINKEANFVLARQTDGDCIVQICDGQGNIISDVDDADLPVQTDECVVPTCNNGVTGSRPADEGDPCGDDELCDGDGVCVECIDSTDCDGTAECNASHVCVTPQCNDEIQNGNETDEDCGGGAPCLPCATGLMCDDDDDCLSGDCNGTCQPSCTDGELSPGEADIDCGGVCSLPSQQCILGSSCDLNADCDSDTCISDVCRPGIFFSEYVEGSGQNKAVEIFNYGNVPLDMSNAGAACTVTVYQNGSSQPANGNPIPLTGTVAAFEVYVLAKSGGSPVPDPDLIALADQTSGNLTFNGNDAVKLECGGVTLDVFGQIGFDPGNGSDPDPGWGTGLINSVDNTLRRKGSVTTGDRIGSDAFVPSAQWDGFDSNDFSGLGNF